MMKELSPAAQAVLDAFRSSHLSLNNLAAALRAVADHLEAAQWLGRIEPEANHSLGLNWSRDALYAIAAELDGSQSSSESDFDG